jgi:hypothetical protein
MHSNRCCYFELRVNNAAHADAKPPCEFGFLLARAPVGVNVR